MVDNENCTVEMNYRLATFQSTVVRLYYEDPAIEKIQAEDPAKETIRVASPALDHDHTSEQGNDTPIEAPPPKCG